MPRHYSDPSRADDKWSLPDVETFLQFYSYCPKCGSLMQDEDASGNIVCLEDGATLPTHKAKSGWFYWFCLPGCMPDSEPFGPFKTEEDAIADAQNQD